MRRGQVLRSTGNEKRMRRHIFAMTAVALVIVTTQNPAAHAQGSMTPSGSAYRHPQHRQSIRRRTRLRQVGPMTPRPRLRLLVSQPSV